ncbi:MAG: OsmC family peroxiredoxin, partial [Bacteroidetes bacterium]|nr:OsmC family peroxiredoxin [Bacteroidota bacterium]
MKSKIDLNWTENMTFKGNPDGHEIIFDADA